jgi:hypothetical protein
MSSRRVESFFLSHVVHEDHKTTAEDRRGRIQHVGSGSERHFDQIQDMIAFITAQIDTTQSIVITCDDQWSVE